MNVYDFDKTIFPTDSAIGFCLWCMNRHPKMWMTFFPKAIKNLVLRKLGKMSEERMQCEFFGYLTMVDDFDVQIERYWDRNEKRIASWYLAQKKPDDLIISASPKCIIEPITKRLGVKCVATEYDLKRGIIIGKLMYGEEKARYIASRDFPPVEEFYSDSLSDTPLARCAKKAYLVTRRATTVVDWPKCGDAHVLTKWSGGVS